MNDMGRRREFPPPRYIHALPELISAAFGDAKALVSEWARNPPPAFGVGRGAKHLVESIREAMFTRKEKQQSIYEEPRSEIEAFLKSCRQVFWALGAFSGLSNVLMLTSSFFMLQVYDRVLPGRSIPTLAALLLLALILYAFQSGLDLVRGRVNVR